MMISDLIKQVFDTSESERSLQRDIGPSEIGGCRRRVWHRLQNDPSVNDTLGMAAFMGTAIHEKIEKRLRDLNDDRYMIEVEVEFNGLMGHVDVYDRVGREVIDWKTITLKKARFFPGEQQWLQVHLYGLLLTENGFPVDTVSLVGIPRDGSERDVVVRSEPWNRAVAEEGLRWLESVRGELFAPEPEKPVSFCQSYCQFWSDSGVVGCPGKP
jgi:hypothetical protein